MAKPSTYWPRLAMNENIGCGNQSPYTRYLLKLRVSSNCFNFLPKQIRSSVRRSTIIDILNQQRATSTTTFSMVNPGAGPSDSAGWFKPKPWLADSGSSQIFASFRVCNAGLGNRGPAKNGKFYKFCELCSEDGLGLSLNNEVCLEYYIKSWGWTGPSSTQLWMGYTSTNL